MAEYTAFVEAGNGLVELLRENMTPEPISKRDLISLCSPHESENNQVTVYLFHIEEDKQSAPNGGYMQPVSYTHLDAYKRQPLENGSVLCLRVQDRVLAQGIEANILTLALYAYGALAMLILLSLFALGEVALGAKRITRGIDLLAAGAPKVRVIHRTGDEMEALAAAFNDLSSALEEKRENAALAGSAYLRFVPRRLVALLGASNIEQVDKNTCVSHEIAMMVVRFHFPKAMYQREAKVLFDSINEVFAHIAGPVSSAGGTIYNFTHDGFDAVFESGSKAAVGAAVEVRQALLDLNAQRQACLLYTSRWV